MGSLYSTENELDSHERLELLVSFHSRTYINTKIPNELIKLICDYFGGVLFGDSTLLNHKQSEQLIQLLSQRFSFNQTQLLLNSTKDEHTRQVYIERLSNNAPYLFLIETNHGNIFGGYTTIDITAKGKEGPYYDDGKAFVFVLKPTQEIMDVNWRYIECSAWDDASANTIYYGLNYKWGSTFISFGSRGAQLCIEDDITRQHVCYGGGQSCYKVNKGNILCGGNTTVGYDKYGNVSYGYFVKQIEIWSIPESE